MDHLAGVDCAEWVGRDQITACYTGGSDDTCYTRSTTCRDNDILSSLSGDYDVNQTRTSPTRRTSSPTPRHAHGAESTWQETNDNVYSNLADTSDWMRNSRLDLEYLIDSGVWTIVFDGDADYILNFEGVETMVATPPTTFSSEFNSTTWNFNGSGMTRTRPSATSQKDEGWEW
ncbi:uncharacterized protein B0H18DRAFT_958360 [Fomitopsis serialis]|uniref:uncharacterized protein n=1 Tax=Fomitopsis serialis TaxID=139415 RepID=UPI002007B01D|nr:uncharacterized protein B0H18DRAFT_958360 [Neoantrodia serialis]KAH9917411.1 hypothetical protein B0H18DRAFT_958360 [Neoantrodia serialis]